MIRGSCLCQGVRFGIQSALSNASHCHCSMCRKALGVLDDDPGVRPAMHIFVGSKAPWLEIADGLPQHAEGT